VKNKPEISSGTPFGKLLREGFLRGEGFTKIGFHSNLNIKQDIDFQHQQQAHVVPLAQVQKDSMAHYLEQFPSPCTEVDVFFEMKAYSMDLRERVVAACGEPGARIYQVAARFRVSVAFVDKLLRRQRTTGSVAALPACGGPAPRLDPAGRAQLLVCLGQQPDATLDEVRAALAASGGPALSRTAVWRAVESMGWGRKKKAFTPPNATPSGS